MTNNEMKLANLAARHAGERPIIVEYRENRTWLVGFKNKLAAYTLFVEYYKCSSNVRVGFSENLNCYFVTA